MRKFAGFLMALAFGAFALPASAHYVTLQMSAGAPGTLTAKITNTSPSGPYTINSLKMPIGGTGTNVGGVGGVSVSAYSPGGANPGVSISGGNILIPNGINLARNQSITLTLTGVTPSPASCSTTSTKWSVKAYEDSNYGGYLYQPAPSGNILTVNLTPACYTITATSGPNGSISPAGTTTVNPGGGQAYAITANPNYHIVDVKVDGASVGAVAGYTFSNVTANHTISATFAINTYTINASAGANGSISPSGAVSVNYGANQTFTITPNANYDVADVLVDGVSAGAMTSYTFTGVTVGHTIVASFTIKKAGITASAGANGTISPSGTLILNYGANQTYTITPNTGYHIADVQVDGASVGAVTTYTFTNVTAPHTITAGFAINTFTITATAGSNGSITPSGPVTVNYGANQAFTIAPASTGYYITDVTVDTVSAGAVAGYTFSNVTANHTISASFARKTLSVTSAPTNAALATPFDVVVGINPSDPTVVVSIGSSTCNASATGGQSTGTSATLSVTIPATAPLGLCTIQLVAGDYQVAPVSLNVYHGVVGCDNTTNYDSSNGNTDFTLDPNKAGEYIGTAGWGVRRGPNTDGNSCVKVNLTCALQSNNVASCVYDKVASQQNAALKYVVLWNATKVDATGLTAGWAQFRPQVSWGIDNPVLDTPDYVPALSCVEDVVDITTLTPAQLLALLPVIPPVAPFTTSSYSQYQPGQVAKMCIAQQGATSVGVDDSGNILIQFWDKVIDQSDGFVKGPSGSN
jgi:hypothetical protein